MDESALPDPIRRKASITPGGEYAWRTGDVEEAITAACDTGLACLGGQVQFQVAGRTFEAYWVTYDPGERRVGEPWREFATRSCRETLEAFRRVCRETDFRVLARHWEILRNRVASGTYDPTNDLWFVLYFQAEPPSACSTLPSKSE
jgi:hypothetical protein